MAKLTFTSGKPSFNWEALLQDILENGVFSPVGAISTKLSLDYNGMHFVLNGVDLLASAGRTIISGTITGFTLSDGNQKVLTMTGLTLLGAADLQAILSGSYGQVPGSEAFRSLFAPLFTRETVNATGSNSGDTILGSANVDNINGAGGNDYIRGGKGVDTLSGGAGTDTVEYRFDVRTVGIKADLGASTVVNNTIAASKVDTISGFENLVGSTRNDVILGSSGGNKLSGDSGNDTISGLAGDDGLFGGVGNDVLSGGAGNNYYSGGAGADKFIGGKSTAAGQWDKVSYESETGGQGIVVSFTSTQAITVVDTYGTTDTGSSIEEIKGSSYDDTFNGSSGDESAEGMDGNDTFKMGAGVDQLVYLHEYDSGTRKGVVVNLSSASVIADIGSGAVTVLAASALDSFGKTDSITGVEDIVGTRYADYIVGGNQSNQLHGESGNDFLLGYSGADILIGGLGKDFMQGGTGVDTFRFNSASETGATASTRDIISGFVHLTDELNLAGVDASTKAAGNNAFSWIKTAAFHGVAGELHYKNVGTATLLEGDRNGDSKADFVIEFATRVSFTLDDIIL